MERNRVLTPRSRIVVVVALLVFELFFFLYTQNRSKIFENSRADVIHCKMDLLKDYEGKNERKIFNDLERKKNKLEKQLLQAEDSIKTERKYNYSPDVCYQALEELCEQKDYINTFQDTVKEVSTQADFMGGISIFNSQDSFSQRNLQKTAKDYTKLQQVEPVFFQNDFLLEFFSFTPLRLILLVCGIFYAMVLADHHKQGLRCLLFSTERGRARLAISRMWTLALFTVITTVLFSVVNLLLSIQLIW